MTEKRPRQDETDEQEPDPQPELDVTEIADLDPDEEQAKDLKGGCTDFSGEAW
jgi:hypothetical protein